MKVSLWCNFKFYGKAGALMAQAWRCKSSNMKNLKIASILSFFPQQICKTFSDLNPQIVCVRLLSFLNCKIEMASRAFFQASGLWTRKVEKIKQNCRKVVYKVAKRINTIAWLVYGYSLGSKNCYMIHSMIWNVIYRLNNNHWAKKLLFKIFYGRKCDQQRAHFNG